MKNKALRLTFLFFISLAACDVLAEGWVLKVTPHERVPTQLLAVDKKNQALFVFERHSPLKLSRKFTVTTGQNDGDKFREGDMKTPEGVYFVEKRLTSGLSYAEYGEQAYTLNFPNPIDRLKGKKGHGIWIHGRGRPIEPWETRGCVVMANNDLRGLQEKYKLAGIPVAIADKVVWKPESAEKAKTPEMIAEIVNRWAEAWRNKSPKYFDFYDDKKFTQATGIPFAKFQGHKELLFRDLPWIELEIHDLRIVEGPDYWVAYFGQYYRSPNLISQGIKRLYFMQGTGGKWLIAGEEFKNMDLGLEKKTPPAAEELQTAAARQKTPPRQPSQTVVAQAQPPVQPTPVPTKPAPSQAAQAPAAAEPAPPAQPLAEAAVQPAIVIETSKPIPDIRQDERDFTITEDTNNIDVNPEMAVPDDARDALTAWLESWRLAWINGDLQRYLEFYNENAVQDSRRGRSAISEQKSKLWTKSLPEVISFSDFRILPHPQGIMLTFEQTYSARNGYSDRGKKTLVLETRNADWKIVEEQWSPM